MGADVPLMLGGGGCRPLRRAVCTHPRLPGTLSQSHCVRTSLDSPTSTVSAAPGRAEASMDPCLPRLLNSKQREKTDKVWKTSG